jgi:hypothetical protein
VGQTIALIYSPGRKPVKISPPATIRAKSNPEYEPVEGFLSQPKFKVPNERELCAISKERSGISKSVRVPGFSWFISCGVLENSDSADVKVGVRERVGAPQALRAPRSSVNVEV